MTQFGLKTGHATFNGGFGGETSTQIKAHMLADTARHSWPTIIWAGNNNITDEATVLADIASMVAALGHQHYLVLSMDNNSDRPIGNVDYNHIISINAALAATYGAHYVDVRSYLVSLYDPAQPQDVIDHDNDIPPTSLRADGIHLNNAGYLAVANYLYTYRAQLGLN